MTVGSDGVRSRKCVANCTDELVSHNVQVSAKRARPFLLAIRTWPVTKTVHYIYLSDRWFRSVIFLNRCVSKHATDTANSVIKKLGLDNFYKVGSLIK